MLVVLPPIFVADTKIIYGYNFVAPLTPSKFNSMSCMILQISYYISQQRKNLCSTRQQHFGDILKQKS